MATVIIGGTEYQVGELNFIALERAWPFIEEAMSTLDPMKGPSAGISIVAAGLCESENFNLKDFGMTGEETPQLSEDQIFNKVVYFLKKRLKATEITGVRQCIYDILEEAGMGPAEGEEAAGDEEETPNPSTEISIQSSLSLLQQDAKEEVGTE